MPFPIHHFLEQVLLALKVMIKTRLLHVAGLRQVIHAGLRIPFSREEMSRVLQNCFPPDLKMDGINCFHNDYPTRCSVYSQLAYFSPEIVDRSVDLLDPRDKSLWSLVTYYVKLQKVV